MSESADIIYTFAAEEMFIFILMVYARSRSSFPGESVVDGLALLQKMRMNSLWRWERCRHESVDV